MADIVIIGGGFSGTLAAIEALSRSKQTGGIDEVILVEKVKGQTCGGVAYSKVTAAAYHETNIAAKNMGIPGDPQELARQMHVDAKKVMPRRLVQKFMEAALNAAKTYKPSDAFRPAKFTRVDGEAVDIIDGADHAKVKLKHGKPIEAQRVIVATGNLQLREIPCVTDGDIRNKFFRQHFVRNQWLDDEQKKIANIPVNEPVLIIGTALSGYDAARSLLRQGHTGKIVMMSRHGLEHFKYPESHDWQDLTLPTPKFFEHVLNRDWASAKTAAEKEFHQLTSLKVDMDAGTIKPDSEWQRMFSFITGRKTYLPEQVLKQWEKTVPQIASDLGAQRVGQFLKKYSALISVLRVGAGHAICEEISAAKASGQLSVVAADIDGVIPNQDEDGLVVRFTPHGESKSQYQRFHTVISSLGPDHDYTHTQSRLWQNMFRRGYTSAHPVGIGVRASTNDNEFGLLPHANRIFAAGVSTAGNNIVKKGLTGPPAFSVPGMRDGVVKTADAAVDAVLREKRGRAPSIF